MQCSTWCGPAFMLFYKIVPRLLFPSVATVPPCSPNTVLLSLALLLSNSLILLFSLSLSLSLSLCSPLSVSRVLHYYGYLKPRWTPRHLVCPLQLVFPPTICNTCIRQLPYLTHTHCLCPFLSLSHTHLLSPCRSST
ncbi:hypothetical protein LX36DRAFT_452053 [Colletotrichum falcatum]|nr:hypothetical protein LX36DRAFT_452053 [Colletotrichum falcatum]